MKKLVAVILGILGAMITVIGITSRKTTAVSIPIIGGADGPTSIFLAGKIGNGFFLSGIVLGIILILLAVILFNRWKK